MPLPPTDRPETGRISRNPARVLLDSPLAASTRARVYHRTRQKPRERGLRVLALLFSFVLHVLLLVVFLFAPVGELPPPHESKLQAVQVRLIETPEPPPPPAVKGAPPKVLGPRHQGHAARAVATAEHSANVEAPEAARPPSVPPAPVVAQVTPPKAPARKRAAAPKPPVSLPHPAPTPQLQPVPLAGEPPTITLPTPTVQKPVPPKFQPESVRRPQLEGNQPMPPPPSLAMPDVPPQSPPPIAAPSIALNTDVPSTVAPPSITVAPAPQPAAPPVPELQAVPLPAQASPTVNLQTQLTPPTPSLPQVTPQVQAPSVEVAEAQLEAVPLEPVSKPQVETHAPAVKIDVADQSLKPAVQPSVERPQLAPATAAAATPATPATQPAASTTAADADKSAQQKSAADKAAASDTASAAKADSGHDVSSAPDAIPFGSDTATPGELNGVANATPTTGKHANGSPTHPGQGLDKGTGLKGNGIGDTGGNQPGTDHGDNQGKPGSYVELKPSGDTNVMNHGRFNIDYKSTRFDQAWTPKNESSVDTVLRHAVEKTTVGATGTALPGMRSNCSVSPLDLIIGSVLPGSGGHGNKQADVEHAYWTQPNASHTEDKEAAAPPRGGLNCNNPDSAAAPASQKLYDRLNMAPANPVVPTAPAASVAQPAAEPVKFDNAAACATARVSGGPLPPSCQGIVLPVKPASSSSSWVPASDQFH